MTAARDPGRRRSGRPSRGDLREQAILDAAQELLSGAPLEALTVEAIAGGAGISRASLYFYFASKDDVALALARRSLDVLSAEASEVAADEQADPFDGVRRVVERAESLWRTHGSILGLVHGRADRDDAFGELWRQAMDADIAAATSVLRRAGAAVSGPASSPALASALCHMTADAFARASVQHTTAAGLSSTAATVLVIWRSVLDEIAR